MRAAVVVGAGIGGLATAGALARTGWQVTLLERADRLRPGRAAVLLWPSGVRALRALDLGGGLDAIATPLPNAGIRRPDGQWIRQPDDAARDDGATLTQGPVVVHRGDLHDTLIAGLGDRMEIRTGVDIRTVRTAGDQPAVSDGRSTWEADLIVAADGVDSVLRQRLAPNAALVSAGYAAWRAVIPWYRAPHLPAGVPASGETIGAGQRFLHASLGERGSSGASARGGIYWVATAPGAARPEPPDVQLALLQRWFAGWHGPIGELLAATEPGDLVQDAVGELRPMPDSFVRAVGTGGFVLLGDAAHAMTYHVGQGACLALEDAATLQALVREVIPGAPLRSALTEYDRIRRPRVTQVVRQARRVGAMLAARGRLTARARDAALVRFAPRLIGRAAPRSSDWEPPESRRSGN